MNVRVPKEHRNKQINYGGSLYPVMQSILLRESKIRRAIEHFWVASLDNKNRLVNVELINLGAVNRVHVKPPEVFRIAIYKAAPRVVLVHNHPSGVLGKIVPNDADRNFTDHMIKAGKLLNIDVADHLVITETEYYSFNDHGYILLLSQSGKYQITTAESEDMKKWKIKVERKLAAEEKAKEIAVKMVKDGFDADTVVKYSGLRKTSINKMIREMGKK
jgi:DNA repair protein RadC